MQLLTTGSSPNPRWIIQVEGPSSKDEEVYEHSFAGKVLSSGMESGGSTTEVTKTSPGSSPQGSDAGSSDSRGRIKRTKKQADGTLHVETKQGAGDELTHNASAEGDNLAVEAVADTDNTAMSQAIDSKRSSPAHSDISAAALARLSARETRRNRRQATAPVKPVVVSINHPVTAAVANINRKRKLSGAAKLAVKKKREREEDCVKIKFLTGTLLLYRGPLRRAEFVRRVWRVGSELASMTAKVKGIIPWKLRYDAINDAESNLLENYWVSEL